ncbi:MAG: Mrp/NBP35 family ATP-binding protein [Hyphomicrobiales bacterium]|nr:Mrp/NBP35 family ATP-binding protein [Hyphomicrobiales bacterium]
MISKEQILAAIQGLPGPDGRPLGQSNAVSGLSLREGKVFLALAVEPSQASAAEPARAAVEKAIRALPGVQSALVTLTSEAAPAAAAPQRAAAAPAAQPGSAVPGVARIIAVASGKGGVGKSTTSANLALALAGLGLRVGVLDADVFGPSMPRLFGIAEKPQTAADGKLLPIEKFGVKVMSIGFLVEERQAIVWRGPMVMSALKQLLMDVAWGELDVLVVDMPPGTGDAQLTMAQNASLAGAVIVSTPQDLALIDARRGVAMFEQVHVPLIGIVENMSYFICPHCGERSDIFAHGGARAEAEKLRAPFLGEIPLHMAIRETADAGAPIVASDPKSPQAQAYMAIAQDVRAFLAQGSRPAPRIVMN